MLVECASAATVVNAEEAARLQMVPQRLDLLVGELRVAVAGQVEEGILGKLRLGSLHVLQVEADCQA